VGEKECTDIRPVVRVPVLSKRKVVRVAAVSMEAPDLKMMPCWAATPAATMMAVGEASTRAHGQEMTMTVMAKRSAKAKGAALEITPDKARLYQTTKQPRDSKRMARTK
jgi:hypothetical protein